MIGWIDEVHEGLVYGRLLHKGKEKEFSIPLLQVMESARVDLEPGRYVTFCNGYLAVNSVMWTTHDMEQADIRAKRWADAFRYRP